MSVPDEEIRSAVDDENGGRGVEEKGKEKQRGGGFGANFRKAKQVVRRRLLGEKTDRRLGDGASSSAAAGGGGCLGKRVLGGCFVGPGKGESSFRSNTSDPNDPNFTYGMLKSMIEKNDFYSRECNTHVEFKRE